MLKRWIALELKHLRKQSGLKQKDAAARLDRSQQHIVNLESARNLPSAGDLELLLGLYGMRERIEFMRELLTAAKRGKNWWTNLSSAVPKWFDLSWGSKPAPRSCPRSTPSWSPGCSRHPATPRP